MIEEDKWNITQNWDLKVTDNRKKIVKYRQCIELTLLLRLFLVSIEQQVKLYKSFYEVLNNLPER